MSTRATKRIPSRLVEAIEDGRLISVPELQAALGIGRTHAYSIAHRLGAVRVGDSVRINPEAVADALRSGRI